MNSIALFNIKIKICISKIIKVNKLEMISIIDNFESKTLSLLGLNIIMNTLNWQFGFHNCTGKIWSHIINYRLKETW